MLSILLGLVQCYPELQREVIQAGDGKTFPKNGDKVTVHYTGTFANGTVFDSSVKRGTPFDFKLGAGQVIKGWDQGVALMSLGEKCMLKIPYQLAYGEQGAGRAIPPRTDINFEVELLKIN